jgi:regulatory protein
LRSPRTERKQPDAAALHEAALAHVARYATTEVGLMRVLQRRIDRWAREAAGDRDEIAAQIAELQRAARGVVARLAASGAVNDVAFAASRARQLSRAGRSRRAVAAHLATKGVDADTARSAAPDDPDSELAAALVLARRRRIGPFRTAEATDPAARQRELAVLARAGFAQPLAIRALAMPHDEAEELVIQFRR